MINMILLKTKTIVLLLKKVLHNNLFEKMRSNTIESIEDIKMCDKYIVKDVVGIFNYYKL